ncbi:MAG TPA: GTP cyclohydrolase I FolE, partial [Thermosynechococcus sp. M55_K2018_012]|nr:GTP cyclohydrolase I FolE [Thermosynechococcus sp. M55_K2018_012]
MTTFNMPDSIINGKATTPAILPDRNTHQGKEAIP